MSMGYPPMGYYPGPSAMPNFPPPLPAGWSEHTAPDGRTKYYYNSNTKESTYNRPSFAPLPQNGGGSDPPSTSGETKKTKKEKPKQKVPIPDTTWVRVTTNEGNTFYFEKESKRSEWTVPDEIKDAVEAMDRAEREEKEAEEREKREKEEAERLERMRERERIRAEVEEERQRKRKEREEANGAQVDGERDGKVAKKEGAEADEAFEPTEEEDEEEWKRAVAAEFAQQDAATKAKEDEEKEKVAKAEEEAAQKVFAAQTKVSVSVAEGRALFKVSPDSTPPVTSRYYRGHADTYPGSSHREGHFAFRSV